MAAFSPGSRLAPKSASDIQVHPLEMTETLKALTTFSEIFLTSFGPDGRAKLLHNACDGHAILTTSSDRILHSLTINKPAIKLLLSVLKDHSQTYSDFTGLTAIVGTQLITKALDLQIHRRLVMEVYDKLLTVSVEFLKRLRQEFDFLRSDLVLRLINNLYTSKPACLLFGRDLEAICQLTLEAFLKSYQQDSSDIAGGSTTNLLFVTAEGLPTDQSRLYDGVLYQTPQIPVYCRTPVTMTTDVRVALIQTSMAGDSDALLDVTYETDSPTALPDAILGRLLAFAGTVADLGACVVFCQRVVHPTVKQALKQREVLVLDRLGLVYFKALHRLVGGEILDPFCPAPSRLSSRLSSLKHVVIDNNSYVHMTGHHGNSTATLLLCHRSEEAVAELKAVCQSVLSVLRGMTRDPYVLPGAGCWQTQLSRYLRRKKPSLIEEMTSSLRCPKRHVQYVADVFIGALQTPIPGARTKHTAAVVDRTSGHLFLLRDGRYSYPALTCQCGVVVSRDPADFLYDALGCVSVPPDLGCVPPSAPAPDISACRVLDAYGPCVGALRSAVGIASMILGIANYVQDTN